MGRIESYYGNWGQQESFFRNPEFEELEAEYSFLPFSDFKRWIPEDDPWRKFVQSFPFGRLDGIAQLSFLSYTGQSPEKIIFEQYKHTRAVHTQQVAQLGKEIVRQNGGNLFQQEFMMTVGGLHDIATPAHGDATKLVDKKNLDEEDHWQDALDSKQLELLESKGFKLEDIDEAIHNKGVYGKILDIADRISYTMQDAFEIAGNSFIDDINFDKYTSTIQSLLLQDIKLGNIYKDIGVDWKRGDVFFTDPKRLEIFLSLRAYLHKFTYMFPTNQGRDIFFANLIKPFYSESGPEDELVLTPQKLRKMRDYKLMDFLNHAYGLPEEDKFKFDYNLLNWYPTSEWFETSEEADERLEALSHNKKVLIIGKKEVKGFDTGTSYRVVSNNEITSFANLGRSSRIDEIAKDMHGTYIFYTPNDKSTVARIAKKVKNFDTSSV